MLEEVDAAGVNKLVQCGGGTLLSGAPACRRAYRSRHGELPGEKAVAAAARRPAQVWATSLSPCRCDPPKKFRMSLTPAAAFLSFTFTLSSAVLPSWQPETVV
eukprot:COSAG02_NODE_2545_length_8565_cov_7.011339_3_plen_103_part_00